MYHSKFSTFPELSEAYRLKELYMKMNHECSYDEVSDIYDDVLHAFKASDIRQFNEFVEILTHWKKRFSTHISGHMMTGS